MTGFLTALLLFLKMHVEHTRYMQHLLGFHEARHDVFNHMVDLPHVSTHDARNTFEMLRVLKNVEFF